MTLFLDTETYCEIPITRGTHAYAEKVEITVATWAVDDGPLQIEDLTEIEDDGSVTCYMPSEDLLALLRDPTVPVVIQQSAFDRTVMRHAWGIDLAVERIHDTMVHAMAHSLPGGLDKLCEIMGVPADESKHKEGKALIQLFCKPGAKNRKVRRATKASHPAEWQRFLAYAGSDILAMRALYRKLPNWNYRNTNEHQELSLWHLDQRINDRGFYADMDLARSAVVAIGREQRRLADRTSELTNGEVDKATRRDEMLAHILSEYGVDLPDMKKDTLERRIEDPELPDGLRQLLRVRLASTTSSTAKYKKLLGSVSSDSRLRGTVQFCGALRTGRWSGRLFQPQNLPRPDMLQPEIEAGIEAVKADCDDLVLADTMKLLSNALRGMIIASPGKKIVSSDLKNIESVIAAWLAGEQWKLDAFAAIFADPELPDMYVRAYAGAFNVSHEAVLANKKAGGFWRQVGKVMELGLAYEGGVGAFLAFAEVYRLKLEELAAEGYAQIPDAVRTQAEIILGWRKKKRLTTFGLSDKAFVVIESFKMLWRSAHPAIVGLWSELEEQAMAAVMNPGREYAAGEHLRFVRNGAWLRMILPSGRSLCYPAPKITGEGRNRKLSYAGVNQYNRRWGRINTYGGKLFENACQAVARDVMAYNMPAIESAGYEIVMTVHDDVITEAPDNELFTSDRLSGLLASNPPWLTDCPLAADGFEAQRYRKD